MTHKQPNRVPDDPQALQPNDENLYDINIMASANDCTGLIPTPPASEPEADSYTNMYAIPKPTAASPREIEQQAEPCNQYRTPAPKKQPDDR